MNLITCWKKVQLFEERWAISFSPSLFFGQSFLQSSCWLNNNNQEYQILNFRLENILPIVFLGFHKDNELSQIKNQKGMLTWIILKATPFCLIIITKKLVQLFSRLLWYLIVDGVRHSLCSKTDPYVHWSNLGSPSSNKRKDSAVLNGHDVGAFVGAVELKMSYFDLSLNYLFFVFRKMFRICK